MDKILDKIAGAGVPVLVVLVLISTSGLAGAAAIAYVLALLGDSLGMIGGIAVVSVIGVAANAITKYGFDAVFKGVVKRLYEKGETKSSIQKKINGYPISKDLKLKLSDLLNSL